MASEEEEEGADDGSVMMMTVVDTVLVIISFNLGKRTGLKSGIQASIGRKKNFRPEQDSKGVK